MKNSHQRALRGEVGGWSDGATRRNTRFLYSILEDRLDGIGLAVTLTLRDCPPSADAWHRLRKAWLKRMQRLGMLRLHWVTEWQRRGVPHLHCAIWFPDALREQYGDQVLGVLRARIVWAWLEIAATYGVGERGQHVHPIDGPIGWFQYLSKHAARGVKHYQRSAEGIPEAWRKKTGRMWGHWGDWPVREGIRVHLETSDGGFYACRRMVRAWRLADARASGDRHRIRAARRMFTCHDEPQSRTRGWSEWIPEDTFCAFLANLATRGYSVTC